jgi:hypothetical protein
MQRSNEERSRRADSRVPALVDGNVYIRTASALMAFGTK